ncbi:MAG: hypothetical protein ACKV2U_26945 [Bryobacteraceae bacterium]
MPSSAWPIAPNTLVAYGGYANIVQPHTRIIGSIFNGETLLGTSQCTISAGRTGTYSFYPLPATFKSPGSPWNFPQPGEPAEVDFSSILNKTIAGRMDFTIDAGSIQFNLSSVALALTQASGPNYGQSVYPSPIVSSVKIFPELPGDPPPPPPVVPPPPVIGNDDDVVISAATLKTYCESAEGSAVVFTTNVTVSNSGGSSAQISAPCTIDLASNVIFGADGVSLTFEGPLTIQGQGKAGLKLSKSLLSAPVLTVDLRGAGSEVSASESTLRASNGPLAVALGNEGKLEISKRFSGQTDTLLSTGKVTIAAGQKFTAGLIGANVKAPLGIHVNMTGTEANFKTGDGAILSALQGTIEIGGAGSKSLVEMGDTQVLFGQSLSINLAGPENGIKLSKTTLGPPSGTAAGGIAIVAGAGTSSLGQVQGSEVIIRRVGSATVQASKSSANGTLKWEKGTINASGDVLLESGSTTEVKDNSITSTTRIRIFAASGGSCDGSSNGLSAPVVEICPPF